MADWKSYGPEARTQVVAALLNQRDRIPVLLTALEKAQIEPASIEIVARARLMEDSDSSIASRAKAIFQNQNSDRAKVVAEYHDALKLNGDIGRGKKLFEDNCAKCHMPRRDRGRVGPDLSSVSMKTKEELLTSILNPGYAIEPRFTYYMVTTKNGRMYDGVISNETPGMITLRGGCDEGDETILRANIAADAGLHSFADARWAGEGVGRAPGPGRRDRLSARRPVADGKPACARHHRHGAPRRLPAAAIFRARNARACRCRRGRNPPRRRTGAAGRSQVAAAHAAPCAPHGRPRAANRRATGRTGR